MLHRYYSRFTANENVYFLFSDIEFENLEAVTNFTKLFPSQAEANITSVQPDQFRPNSLLVATDTDVYSVPFEGNDEAEHITGKHLFYTFTNN